MSKESSKLNPVVQEAKDLFGLLQTICLENGRYADARKLLIQIQRLARKLADSMDDDYAEALQWQGYALLNISRLARTGQMKARFTVAGYDSLCQAVDLKLQFKRDLNFVFSAYNVGIDLVVEMQQPERARHYLLISRAALRRLPDRSGLSAFSLMVSTALARCEKALGNNEKAARILRASLGRHQPRLSRWDELRTYAQSCELLAQIMLDALSTKRAEAS
jgi:tetratricopeptide (TPR) repeat protein